MEGEWQISVAYSFHSSNLSISTAKWWLGKSSVVDCPIHHAPSVVTIEQKKRLTKRLHSNAVQRETELTGNL